MGIIEMTQFYFIANTHICISFLREEQKYCTKVTQLFLLHCLIHTHSTKSDRTIPAVQSLLGSFGILASPPVLAFRACSQWRLGLSGPCSRVGGLQVGMLENNYQTANVNKRKKLEQLNCLLNKSINRQMSERIKYLIW